MHPNCRVDHRESRNRGVKKDGFCVPVVLFVYLTLGGTASLGSDLSEGPGAEAHHTPWLWNHKRKRCGYVPAGHS